MKSNRIVPAVAGIFLFLAISLTSVWLLSPAQKNEPAEIRIHEIVTKIDDRQIREVKFKQSQVELTDQDGKKFFANLGSDPTRESLVTTIKDYNKVNTAAPIRYTEEPALSGRGWIVFLNSLPVLLFFLMWGATLAVIVYAVRTLSRNKG